MTNQKITQERLYGLAIDQILNAGIEKLPLKFQSRIRNQIQAIFHAYEIKLINHAEAVEDAMTAGKVTAFDIKRGENEAKS